MTDVNGKVALVTGGARGLGEATCRVLASAGARVVAADIREDLAKRLAADVDSGTGTVAPMRLDVRDEAQVAEAIRSIVSEYGALDVLVNCAAIDVTVPITELSVADWDRITATNLRGPFLTSKEALPIMKKQGAGHIVNVTSTAAKRAWENAAAYHATKWGLLGFSHALHVEARRAGVKVTAVVAGGMRTPFLLERFADIDVETLQDPVNVAQTIRFVLSQPDETVVPEIMVVPMRETSWP